MAFKVGQKVVYVPQSKPDERLNEPSPHEIVTIYSKCPVNENCYDISEYLYSKTGREQSFHERHLKPLDYDFVEEVTKQVKPKKQEV